MGAGDHVAWADREQGGVVTGHLHTPGMGHITGHTASDAVRGPGIRQRPWVRGDLLHPDTGQTGLTVLRIIQGHD